jgi:hypothetical protein
LIKRGIRDWTFATLGLTAYGNNDEYGQSCHIYKISLNHYFSDTPYLDQDTLVGDMSDCIWETPEGNDRLDPISGCEDKDDDGITPPEKKENKCPPDLVLNGDLLKRIVASPPWGFDGDLSPHDINNNDFMELPVATIFPPNPDDEHNLAQVLKHVTTHELGHAIGITLHTQDPACLMYQYTSNWIRDRNFSQEATQLIRMNNN